MTELVGQLAPGTTLAGCRIEALIGRGGMGAVYRAVDERLGRKVAIKVIAPELAEDDHFRERLLRESTVAASLDHPHVVPIYQAGEEDGVLFLAMRYVEGSDLAKVIAEAGALEPKRAVDLLAQIAEALDAAHERGLVHRDVKPSNVLIAESAGQEHCYLADFGLTRRTGSLTGVSVAGDVVGTLEYVAPEQITGDSVDGRADVYSLGCVLYECLTGQALFPRATDVALLWAHVHEEPTPPSTARPDLPKELDTVFARALAKEPGRRYRSAGKFIAAVRSALGSFDATPGPKKAPPKRQLLGAAAAVALLALAGGLAFVLFDRQSGLSSVSPDSVGVIDPSSNELVAEVPVGRAPNAIAAGSGGVWVANGDDKTVSRIDPADVASRSATISVPGYPSDLATADGSVLVALGALGKVVRIDPDRNEVGSPTSALGDGVTACRGPGASIVSDAGLAWFVCESGEIGRVDLRTGQSKPVRLADVVPPVDVRNPGFTDAAFGLGALWLVNRKTNFVSSLDPATSKALLPPGPQGPGGWFLEGPQAVASTARSIWVARFGNDSVARLTFERGPRQPFPPIPGGTDVGDGPVDIAVGEGGVWVLNRLDGSVTRIDEETGEVLATIPVGNDPQHIAAGEGFVWVTVRAPDEE